MRELRFTLAGLLAGVAVVLLLGANAAAPLRVGRFQGDGGLLTNIPSASITGRVAVANIDTSFVVSNQTTPLIFTNVANAFGGDGSRLTGIPATAMTVPPLSNYQTTATTLSNAANSLVGIFNGDGTGLSNVTATVTVSTNVDSATVATYVTGNGDALTNQIGAQAYLTVNGANAAGIPVAIRGAANQTANLLELQNNTSDRLVGFTAAGGAHFTDVVIPTNAFVLPSHTATISWLDAPTNATATANPTLWLIVTNAGVGYGIPLHNLTTE